MNERMYTEVYSWGFDGYGQLGISSQTGKTYTQPKLCSFNIVIKEISCGNEHAAIITSITNFLTRRRVSLLDGKQS